MRMACLLAMVGALLGMYTGGHATDGRPAPACSNGRLRDVTLAAQQGRTDSAELGRLLACLGGRADALVAGAAAYELALHHAGANGRPANFRQAADWARRSAKYLRRTPDAGLRRKTELAGVRLAYYAASTAPELEAAARDARLVVSTCRRQGRRDATCAEALQLLGEIERDLFAQGDAGARRRAITAFRGFLATAPGRAEGPERTSALLDKGTLIAGTPEGDLGPDGVREAAQALREAAGMFLALEDQSRMRLAQINLAAFLARHRPSSTEALAEAEALLRPLVQDGDGTVPPEVRLTARQNLGSVLVKKQTGNRQGNLDEAIAVLRAAHASVPRREARTWVKTAEGLAIALEASGVQVERNLQEATALLGEALAVAEQRRLRAETSTLLSTMASIRLHRKANGAEEDLRDIRRQVERARAIAGAGRVRRAELAALAADVASALAAEGDLAAVDTAAAELRRAIGLLDRSRTPVLWATLQNNLGNVCNHPRRKDLAGCAEEAYRQALTVRTEAEAPREYADTIVNLANLRFTQGDCGTAADLYARAAAASRRLFDGALGRDVLLYDAGRSDRWFERAAYCLARVGRVDEAVEMADRGRTRVLKQRLGRADTVTTTPFKDHLHAVMRSGTVVLMPVVTSSGTVVLALGRKDGRVETRQLFLDLDGGAVAGVLDAWLMRYEQVFRSEQRRPDSSGAWNREIVSAGEWAGTQLIGPAMAWVSKVGLWPADEVVLVVQGELALLPLHAGRLPDGRRLLQAASVSYLPSLALWETAPAVDRPRALVSVPDPSQDPGLPYAVLEAGVADLVSGRKVEGVVSRVRMLEAVAGSDILHFVGHARFDPDDPGATSLRLHDGDLLRVRDIEAATLGRAPELVVLSACETGRIETATMANEFVGLPAAFMGLGAKGVVSSLWPANDGPTLFLMARFIEEVQVHGKRPAAALREAQLWLSTSTGAELARVLRSLKPPPDSDAARLERALRFQLRDQRPYAEPWAWAGFFYSGVVP